MTTSGASTSAPAAGVATRRADDTAGPGPVLADAVRAAALATSGVTDLHTGSFGEVATYLPGRRVEGVRIRGDVVEVHLVTAWEAPVLRVADDVRRAVRAVPGLADADVRVVVQDVSAPETVRPPSGAGSGARAAGAARRP